MRECKDLNELESNLTSTTGGDEMKDEDRKALTEFLGECWINIDNFDDEGICKICGECWEVHHNRTFDTWEDFGALWEKIDKKDLVISWIIQGEYERFILQSWRMWERAIPEKRCLIILEATKEGILAP